MKPLLILLLGVGCSSCEPTTYSVANYLENTIDSVRSGSEDHSSGSILSGSMGPVHETEGTEVTVTFQYLGILDCTVGPYRLTEEAYTSVAIYYWTELLCQPIG